mmetsp:Transcript_83650/g.213005  ORF Transcript_83650/g.213005 Transcript_83650/m.213005 type:complete len:226 (-) Transcript_83650:626-1303(-)
MPGRRGGMRSSSSEISSSLSARKFFGNCRRPWRPSSSRSASSATPWQLSGRTACPTQAVEIPSPWSLSWARSAARSPQSLRRAPMTGRRRPLAPTPRTRTTRKTSARRMRCGTWIGRNSRPTAGPRPRWVLWRPPQRPRPRPRSQRHPPHSRRRQRRPWVLRRARLPARALVLRVVRQPPLLSAPPRRRRPRLRLWQRRRRRRRPTVPRVFGKQARRRRLRRSWS